MEKKLNIWNGVVEKANAEIRDFWSFVGRRTLRNVSVTSTKGKLKGHYQRLGSCSVDATWKVDSKVNECHRCSL